ncbi:type II secretion system protein J [Rummeliibacillus pycnus]|uniref:type II secretion system protein J n=1 Tax=Rummeliibacillus pycnus TaxID=101070 RepID=UPI0037CC4EFD
MYKILKNQRGMTLVEILAAVLLMGLVSVLILNVLVESTNQYKEQLSRDKQLNDASYVLKVITKDMRKSTASQINPIADGIEISGNKYQLDQSDFTIKKNNETLINNIDTFTVTKTLNDNEWNIYIKEKSDNRSKQTEAKTTIVLRSGDK